MLIASTISFPSQREWKKSVVTTPLVLFGATSKTSIEHLLPLPHVTLSDCRHIELWFLVSQLCCSANAFQFVELAIKPHSAAYPSDAFHSNWCEQRFLVDVFSPDHQWGASLFDYAPPECALMHIAPEEQKKGKKKLGEAIIMQNIRLGRKTARLRSNKMSMNEFMDRARRNLFFNWFEWKRNPHFKIVVSVWIRYFGSDTSSICRQKLLSSYKTLTCCTRWRWGRLAICLAIYDAECVHEQMSPNKSDKISFWAPINWSCYVCYVCESFKWKTEYYPKTTMGYEEVVYGAIRQTLFRFSHLRCAIVTSYFVGECLLWHARNTC